jgi:hypothetical protein
MRHFPLLLVVACAAGVLGAVSISRPEKPQPATAAAPTVLTYRYGSFVMRLGDEPCPFEELDAMLTSEGVPPAKAYRELQRDGRWRMPGCWATDIGGDVMTRDTAGGEGTIPKDWLTREPGA